MLQLVKADLSGILTLFADYRPQIDRDSLALDIRKLERQEDRDFFFLARREKSCLFPVGEVYLAESYANLCWTAYLGLPGPHVDALYLHVSRNVHGHPFGIVTALDYAASARDVVVASRRPHPEGGRAPCAPGGQMLPHPYADRKYIGYDPFFRKGR